MQTHLFIVQLAKSGRAAFHSEIQQLKEQLAVEKAEQAWLVGELASRGDAGRGRGVRGRDEVLCISLGIFYNKPATP